MKITIPLLSLLLLFSCKKEDDKTTSKVDSTENKIPLNTDNDSIKSIEDIKAEYKILSSKKFDSVSFKYNCNDEREGEVIFFYEYKNLRLIKHFYGEYSHFSSEEQYYLKNNQPFFIYKQDVSWNFDGGTPEKPITKDDIKEVRVYLQNNKPLQCLEKNYSIRSSDPKNPDPSKVENKVVKCDISELMKTYQSLIKNRDKKGEIQCL